MRRCQTSLCVGVVITLLVVAPASAAPVSAEPVSAAPFEAFEATVDGLSWIDSYLLAVASNLAYRGLVKDKPGETFVEKFATVYEPLGLEVVAYLEDDTAKTGTQAIVLRNRSILLIVFCGSEGYAATAAIRDWLTDARIWPIEVDGNQLHRGFHRALESIWEQLEFEIAISLEDRALWLSGHSLGGALANLAAYRLARGGAAVAGVTTFAAPKVGDCTFVTDFEERFGARSQQWSARRDPITRMPRFTDKVDYGKLGVTNVVDITGDVKLDTVLKMAGVPNPLAHRASSYINYLYRALPEDVRGTVPLPPALCAAGDRQVGLHPETRYPLCRGSWRKISRAKCVVVGDEVVESWCVTAEPKMFRYRARKLKLKRSDHAVTSQ